MVGAKHVLVKEYNDSRDIIEENKLEFQQALIHKCGAKQAPAMQSFLFQHLCFSYF